MTDLRNKTDAQLVREWNECLRIAEVTSNPEELRSAVQRQSEIEREQIERMIQKMKGEQ